MSRNGAGAYSLPAGNPVVTGTVISSTTFNTLTSDIATALTASIANDGQTVPVANLPMGGFKLTGLGAATTNGDAVRYEQAALQTGEQVQLYTAFTTGGSSTAYTLTPSPATTANVTNQRFRVKFNAASGATPTLAVSGQTAKNLKYYDSTGTKQAITSTQVPINWISDVEYDGTDWVVLNVPPVSASVVQIQPISASVGSNALTISASALSLDFRSTTLGSGTVTTVAGTPASLVISSGSTLGTVSAKQSRLAVLALNNAGTIELAVVNLTGGVDLTETGVISTAAEGGAGAADSANVIYSTTARTNVAYRVIGYIESTQATAGTWATAPSTIQGVGGQAKVLANSMVRLHTANGYGSTNTTIRRWTTTVANVGADITYADSAANGSTFTINTPGVYAISYSDSFSAGSSMGISLNSSQLTTGISSITTADILSVMTASAANFGGFVSSVVSLVAGDVIRAHTNGTTTGTVPQVFSIVKVA